MLTRRSTGFVSAGLQDVEFTVKKYAIIAPQMKPL
jgi:hypothetical protein